MKGPRSRTLAGFDVLTDEISRRRPSARSGRSTSSRASLGSAGRGVLRCEHGASRARDGLWPPEEAWRTRSARRRSARGGRRRGAAGAAGLRRHGQRRQPPRPFEPLVFPSLARLAERRRPPQALLAAVSGASRLDGLSSRIVAVHEMLDSMRVPHQFGGAIALAWYRSPRATTDIDLNVTLPRRGPSRSSERCAPRREHLRADRPRSSATDRPASTGTAPTSTSSSRRSICIARWRHARARSLLARCTSRSSRPSI